MKGVSVLAAMVMLTAPGSAQTRPAMRDSAVLVALERRVEQATMRGDVAYLDSMYAPSFRFKHSTGELEERGARLAALRAHRTAVFARDLDSLDVEVHGDVALTTGRIHVRQESTDPKWREYTIRYARVYVRRAGRWQLLTHHTTAESFGPLGTLTWMLGPFVKPTQVNPVIRPDSTSRFRSPMNDSVVAWEGYATFNPAAVVRGGKVNLLYRAEDASGERQIGGHTSRLGLAESPDGLHFTRRDAPVLYPDSDAQRQNEWPGGVEDPRLVETDSGTYVLTYTQWNRDIPRLAVATSRDLVSWTKHGPAFARAAGGKYLGRETKSGAILSRIEGDRLIATRVNGKYWMYFGVPDVMIATSDNLLDWTPLEDAEGRLVKVLSPRPGYFDSWLVEAGPPALLMAQGILVLYNAGNSGTIGDPGLPARVYTGGQALFAAHNPIQLLARSEAPFIRPTESYERTGQYTEGTTFVEGLIRFKGRWFLYYGTADSRLRVAGWDPR